MYAGVDGGYIGSISIWSSGVGSADDLVGKVTHQHQIGSSKWFLLLLLLP